MKRKIEEKLKAIELREKGYSLNEIVDKVGVAKSSVSGWVRNVPLNERAKKRLLTKVRLANIRSAESKNRKVKQILDSHYNNALFGIKKHNLDREIIKIACSLIYYCEGGKNHYTGVNFTNSDPDLVKTFLFLLRSGFDIDERKFAPCVHLHQYHNKEKQINFWSAITKIPRSQFIKPYLKPNTGKRIRKNYPGCIGIRYHSTDTARQLLMTAKAFLSIYNGDVV